MDRYMSAPSKFKVCIAPTADMIFTQTDLTMTETAAATGVPLVCHVAGQSWRRVSISKWASPQSLYQV
jgi:hypothetical protein